VKSLEDFTDFSHKNSEKRIYLGFYNSELKANILPEMKVKHYFIIA